MDQPAVEETTEARFWREYDVMKSDLAHARQEILLLSEQLGTANTENEKLSYKCDFLTGEVTRANKSRELYERITIRVAGKMDGAIDGMLAMLKGMQDEIKEAAYTKPVVAPAGTAEASAGIESEKIGE